MCVAAFAWQAHPRWRLVLAGNRDEFHARPAAPLAHWDDVPGVIAGRDLEAGGTWLGVHQAGRCALVTNVRDLRAPQDGRSRGWLASDWLRDGQGALAASDALRAHAPDYRPFNLLLADHAHCVWTSNRPQPRQAVVAPGVHSLSNAALDSGWPKALTLARRLEAWLEADRHGEPEALLQALADERTYPDASLPDTGIGLERERWLSSAFIRGRDYGTRASTVVMLGHDGEGIVVERRWGPEGVALGERRIVF